MAYRSGASVCAPVRGRSRKPLSVELVPAVRDGADGLGVDPHVGQEPGAEPAGAAQRQPVGAARAPLAPGGTEGIESGQGGAWNAVRRQGLS